MSEIDILEAGKVFPNWWIDVIHRIMQDRRLTKTAKVIGCYIFTFSDGKGEVCLSVEKIFNDLNMSKSTFYKHFSILKECGYVTVSQQKEGGKFTHNKYILGGGIGGDEFE